MGKIGDMGVDLVGDAANSLIGFGLNQAASSINAERNYKYWKKQTDYEQQLALENWNRQNEYNSPKSQMQRYAEAGLNPNLIYGQQNTGGTIDLQGASSVNTESAQRMEHIGFMSAYQNAQMMKAQTSLIKQQTLTEANNTLLRSYEAVEKQIEAIYKERKEKNDVTIGEETIKNLKVQRDKLNAELDKIASDISVNNSTISLNKAKEDDIPKAASDRHITAQASRTSASASMKQANTAEKSRLDKAEDSRLNREMEKLKIKNQHTIDMMKVAAESLKLELERQNLDLKKLESDYMHSRDKTIDKISELTGIDAFVLRAIDQEAQQNKQNIVQIFGSILSKVK